MVLPITIAAGATPSLIHDLGIVAVVAIVVTLLFFQLRLPVILGYILSGLLVGPYLLPGSPIRDMATVEALGELGVIFLMFAIGIEFDLKRLRSQLGGVLLAVVFQTFLMMFLGLQAATILNLSRIDGIFFGAILSISSSMVTIGVFRARDELKLTRAQLAVGILILEDILAILLLVVLTGVAVEGRMEFGMVWLTTLGVGVFVVCVYVLGRVLMPKLLNLVATHANPELTTLFSVSLVLGVGVLASNFDFSVALGAFLAGALLTESRLLHQIEHATEPLRNLFGAVFFVSVGMKLDPAALMADWSIILILSVLVIGLKIGSCWLGLFMAGQNPGSSFRAAMGKAQIGEFGFVIAGLGFSLGVLDQRIMTLTAGIAAVTICVTPLWAAQSTRIYAVLADCMPRFLVVFGDFYRNLTTSASERLGKSVLFRMIQRPLLQMVTYLLLVGGILVVASLVATWLQQKPELVGREWLASLGVWSLAALAILPFGIAVIRNVNAVVMLLAEVALPDATRRQLFQGRVGNFVNFGVTLLVVLVVAGLFLSAASAFFPSGIMLTIFVALVLVAGILTWRRMIRINNRIEVMFMESFNQQAQSEAEQRREAAMQTILKEYPWEIKVNNFEIEEGMVGAGKRIMDLKLRQKTGASIVALSRGKYIHYDPGPDVPLFPGDRLFLFGADEQIQAARGLIGATDPTGAEDTESMQFNLQPILVGEGSPLAENTLSGLRMRRRFGVSVLGIQRGDERISVPPPDEVIKSGDVLYVVGNPDAVKKLQQAREAELVPG
ncbi:MAG: cation:proton antiporter [Opitutales bacterium]